MAEDGPHVITPRTYAVVFAALLVLMAATIFAGGIDMGQPFNIIIALGIAVTKMMLIVLFFMHVIHSSRLTWIFFGAGLFWFFIMVAITVSDYVTRDWSAPIVPGW
ncbi:MAG: cytochrome C oxidase subunit IV family protein [Candidatus Hydrogenedentota bacterium]